MKKFSKLFVVLLFFIGVGIVSCSNSINSTIEEKELEETTAEDSIRSAYSSMERCTE